MSTELGMNIDQCNGGHGQIIDVVNSVKRIGAQVTTQMQGTSGFWHGPDADRFRRQNVQAVNSAFADLEKAINAMATTLNSNIRQQQGASA